MDAIGRNRLEEVVTLRSNACAAAENEDVSRLGSVATSNILIARRAGEYLMAQPPLKHRSLATTNIHAGSLTCLRNDQHRCIEHDQGEHEGHNEANSAHLCQPDGHKLREYWNTKSPPITIDISIQKYSISLRNRAKSFESEFAEDDRVDFRIPPTLWRLLRTVRGRLLWHLTSGYLAVAGEVHLAYGYRSWADVRGAVELKNDGSEHIAYNAMTRQLKMPRFRSRFHIQAYAGISRRIVAILGFAAVISGGAVLANEPAVYRMSTSVAFVDATNERPIPNVKAFRRYGFGRTGLPNVMDFRCATSPGAMSHMVFRLPEDFPLRSFPRQRRDPRLGIIVRTDTGRFFHFTSSYYNGEFFIDRRTDVKEAFDEVLSSNSISIRFGEHNDLIQFDLDVRVDNIFTEMIDSPTLGPSVAGFRQMSPQEVIDRCAAISPAEERLNLRERIAPVRCGPEERGTVCRVANRQFLWCKDRNSLPAFEQTMRSAPRSAHRDIIRQQQGACDTSSAIIMNAIGIPENVWEGNASHPAVSKTVLILPLFAVNQPPVHPASSSDSAAPASSEGDHPPADPARNTIPYGSRAGMELTIIERRGIGTANARIRVVHTEANARSFCIEYAQDSSPACVRRAMREVRPRSELTANCRTGIFTDAFGQRYQFRGPRQDGTPPFRIINLASRENLDGSSASGYPVAIEQFQALCSPR